MDSIKKFNQIRTANRKKQKLRSENNLPTIIFGDGAMGTELMKYNKNLIPFLFNLDAPNKTAEIHQNYLQAGANIITTNTFCANRLYLKQTNIERDKKTLPALVTEINQKGADIAVKQVERFKTKNPKKSHPLIAGSIGPTGSEMAIFPQKNNNFKHLVQVFTEQITALLQGGVDILIFETFSYHLELEAALKAAAQFSVPAMVNMSFDNYQNTNYGTDVSDFSKLIKTQSPNKIISVGLNCIAPSPGYQETITNIIQELKPIPLSIYYNAGKPNLDTITGQTSYELGENFYQEIDVLASRNEPDTVIIGGCCGTTPDVIEKLSKRYNRMINL
ncbi:MAG: homocysteine S-methyltransferase family protein [Bacillota bacterium]